MENNKRTESGLTEVEKTILNGMYRNLHSHFNNEPNDIPKSNLPPAYQAFKGLPEDDITRKIISSLNNYIDRDLDKDANSEINNNIIKNGVTLLKEMNERRGKDMADSFHNSNEALGLFVRNLEKGIVPRTSLIIAEK